MRADERKGWILVLHNAILCYKRNAVGSEKVSLHSSFLLSWW